MLYTGTLELSRIAPYPVECQDHVKGVQLIEEAANLGNIKAIYQLRDLYADTDIDKYEYWGGKLVSRRDADAALDLAKAYLEGQANPYLDQSSADFLRFVEASKMLHEAAQLRSLKALTMWNLQAWGRKTDLSHKEGFKLLDALFALETQSFFAKYLPTHWLIYQGACRLVHR